MKTFSQDELLTIANVLFDKGYALLENHAGDATFEQRAQELFLLAGKAQEQWHKTATKAEKEPCATCGKVRCGGHLALYQELERKSKAL